MSNYDTLLSPLDNERISLKNKVVMAPLTRSRSTADHIPTDIMTTYYGERAGVGLIITEGTAPSPNGVGYPRIPGVYNMSQVEAWKSVTKAVHERDSKIFLQLMHTGRVSHPDNMPEATTVLAPSPIPPRTTKMHVDGKGELEIPTPTGMSLEDIKNVKLEYVKAAKNAIEAGFDGVEIHSANGYLLDQFLNPQSNHRTDEYGGSIENRCRLVIEVAQDIAAAIPNNKIGIRFSPNGAMNDVGPFDEQEDTFDYLATQMEEIGLVYIHLVDHSSMGAPELPETIRQYIRDRFSGLIILCGGYNAKDANKALVDKKGDLIAFGRTILANPDLVTRFEKDAELNDPHPDTFYTPGPEGYIDYPTLEEQKAN